METTHIWLVNIMALQVICLISMGFQICCLAKRDPFLAKVKAYHQTLVCVRQSPRVSILQR